MNATELQIDENRFEGCSLQSCERANDGSLRATVWVDGQMRGYVYDPLGKPKQTAGSKTVEHFREAFSLVCVAFRSFLAQEERQKIAVQKVVPLARYRRVEHNPRHWQEKED